MVRLCYMQFYSYQPRLKPVLSYVYNRVTVVCGWIGTAYLKLTPGSGINIPKYWTRCTESRFWLSLVVREQTHNSALQV